MRSDFYKIPADSNDIDLSREKEANMAIGIVGKKSGMTRIFTDDGASIPVTVVEVQPNRVTQIKTTEVDGYSAVQITTGNRRASRVYCCQAQKWWTR